MATYYWVGGTGTWSGSGNTQFAASSGGVPTLLNPTSADTVNFDAASGTGTCTTDATAAAAIITLNSSTLGLTLGANLTISGGFTLTLGAFTLGNNNFTCGVFFGNNSNVRSIAFGTGAINVANNNATVWGFNTVTNFSYTGLGTVNFTYSGAVGTRTINHASTAGGAQATSLNFNVTAGTDIVQMYLFVNSLNFTGFLGTFNNSIARTIYGDLTFSAGMTFTGNAGFTFASASGTQKITSAGKTFECGVIFSGAATYELQDALTLGITRTLTLTSGTFDLKNLTLTTGLFSSSNSNVRAINFGTGNITITGNAGTVWAAGNVANFSYTGTPTINCTYSGSTGTRTLNASTTSGSEANALTFNISAGSDIVTFGNNNNVKNVNFTGFSGTFSNTALSVYGNYTISSGMTVTAGANAVTFAATSGTQQITTNGKTLDMPLTFNGIGGTFAFQDALTQGSTRAFTVTNGTVQLKVSATSTVGSFVTSGTNQKFLQSTSAGTQATLSQASGTVSASYLTIKDINATGGATWNAFTTNNNIDAGNNLGWDFSTQIGRYIYTRRKNKRILS
jgi:hypothetical protein